MSTLFQGAWLSGIREAARIADLYLGCPFSASSAADPECVLLDSDDDEEQMEDSTGNGETASAEQPMEAEEVKENGGSHTMDVDNGEPESKRPKTEDPEQPEPDHS
ncbi:hypothetical protein Aduo_001785 [Ancylostoma duodenale]